MVSSKNFIQKSNYFKENKIIATKCCKIVLLVERAKKVFFIMDIQAEISGK